MNARSLCQNGGLGRKSIAAPGMAAAMPACVQAAKADSGGAATQLIGYSKRMGTMMSHRAKPTLRNIRARERCSVI